MFISIIIPAYNEEKNIKKGVLNEVAKYLKTVNFKWEVVLVDDGSTDKTLSLLNKFTDNNRGFRVLSQPHRGKGGTVIAGMLTAVGDWRIFLDFDQATPISEIVKILPKFNQDYGVVIGTRTGREGAPIVRKLMAYGFMVLRNLILRLPYRDTQCGFKAFSKKAAGEIFGKLKRYKDKVAASGAAVTVGFDLEILYLARKLKYKVAEVPVLWHHKDTERISPFKDSVRGLIDLFKVRLNASAGKYKI
ncbi:glycosyltransferase [Patescibacteria group bacterium]